MARKDTQKSSSRGKSLKKANDAKKSSSRDTQSETYRSKPRTDDPMPRAQAAKTRKAKPAAGDDNGKTEAPATKGRSTLKAAASTVGNVLKRVKARLTRKAAPAAEPEVAAQPSRGRNKAGGQKAARVARREADIPMDQITGAYTPAQTSLKGPFRASGADRQRDQDFANGVGDDRWNDEDRLTNKSGDPRIGTHGRTYEPGEARAASGRKRNSE